MAGHFVYEVSGDGCLGIGYVNGRPKFRGIGLGMVTGSLLGRILIGTVFHVPVSDQAKAMLFLLRLLGIGYSTRSGFFQSLKVNGWRWAALGVFVPIMGRLAAYAVARYLAFDPGYVAGMLSGALTESPAIGTASEAIRALALPSKQKEELVADVTVANAICYIFGTLGIWCCSSLVPKLLRINLQDESKRVEASSAFDQQKGAFTPLGSLSRSELTRSIKMALSSEKLWPMPSHSCRPPGFL